ncbi:hypothetical protein GE09DRAFT_1067695 [Coniochaeta sp. 2T2.1]|nr:hypothetical protein GE09DRAFT_1067695 [Coniochaeta sp. 2T2.1]
MPHTHSFSSSHFTPTVPDLPMPDWQPVLPPPPDYCLPRYVSPYYYDYIINWNLEFEISGLRQWIRALNTLIKAGERELGGVGVEEVVMDGGESLGYRYRVKTEGEGLPAWLVRKAELRAKLWERRISLERSLAWRKGEEWEGLEVALVVLDEIE